MFLGEPILVELLLTGVCRVSGRFLGFQMYLKVKIVMPLKCLLQMLFLGA